MQTVKWEIGVLSYTVIIGRDPECADIDNPRGEVYGERYWLVARAPNGAQKQWNHSFNTEHDADMFARTLDQESPNHDQNWQDARPVYGSEAFIAGGWSEIDAADERNWQD